MLGLIWWQRGYPVQKRFQTFLNKSRSTVDLGLRLTVPPSTLSARCCCSYGLSQKWGSSPLLSPLLGLSKLAFGSPAQPWLFNVLILSSNLATVRLPMCITSLVAMPLTLLWLATLARELPALLAKWLKIFPIIGLHNSISRILQMAHTIVFRPSLFNPCWVVPMGLQEDLLFTIPNSIWTKITSNNNLSNLFHR